MIFFKSKRYHNIEPVYFIVLKMILIFSLCFQLSAEIESNLTQAFEFSDESNTESSAIKNELLFTDLLNFSQIPPFELNILPFSRF